MTAQLNFSNYFHRLFRLILCLLASLLLTASFVSAAWSAVTSDDFSASNLNTGLWRLHDPLGDAVVSLVGTGTGDARLSVAVPAGASHDLWTTDTAPRLLQAVSNNDFRVELKFDSALSQRYQGQGLIVQQDDNTWLRFDLYSNGTTVYVYAASKSGGTMSTKINSRTTLTGASLYLKVERSGQQWTQSYSADGVSWTTAGSFSYALNVTELGPFAGNFSSGGNAPAHTALVDYLFNNDSPIIPEDGGTSPQLWTVSTSVIGNGNIALNPAGGSYTEGTVVSVTATAGAGWSFNGWSGNLSGNVNPESLLVNAAKSITATFTSLPIVPTITNVQVNPQPTEATLTWKTDVPATSRVEYGETSSYGTVIEDLIQTTGHRIVTVGLTPGMVYHYRISSANEAGSVQTTADMTFTTPTDSIPGAVVSDDFSTSSLNTSLWRIHDPLGDAVVSLVGTGTGDARLGIAVPAGASHDLWTTDTAPRLLQAVSNNDFKVELKFDSPLTQKYQGEGLIVQQDDNTWLRFDLYSNGTTIYAYSASKSGGTMSTKINSRTTLTGASLYLKVERSGQQWTQSYSADGVNWTTAGSFSYALNVTELGPFAGNFSSGNVAPAHTALVDYLFNSGSPIIPEDGGTSPQLWRVSTSVIGNGSIALNPAGGNYAEGTVVSVMAAAGAGWNFSGWSGNLSGDVNPESLLVDAAKSVTASFVPEPTAPMISNIVVSSQETNATVSWTTDVPASSRVDYGETIGYGSTVGDATLVTSHSLQLAALHSNTTYHYQVSSGNSVGTSQTTADLTFTTQPSLDPSGIISDDFNSANLNQSLWTLVNPLNDAIVVIEGAGSGDSHLLLSVPGGPSHDPWTNNQAARLMQPVNNVDFVVEVKFDSKVLERYQDQGVIIEQDEDDWLRFDVYSDGTSTYVFSAIQIAGVMSTRVNSVVGSNTPQYLRVNRVGNLWREYYSYDGLNWLEAGSFTHTLAATAVGPFVGNYNTGNNAPAHTAIIDYFFNAGEPIIPEDGGVKMDNQPPLIQQLSHVTRPESLQVSWFTDELATARVEYGRTPLLELGSEVNSSLLTAHSVTVSGLTPETDYYYRVVSTDALGNRAVSIPRQIRTPALSGKAPVIDVWYGLEQTFGQIGIPQRYANILGNVTSSSTVSSLTYSLNGGPEIPLTVGPDGLRLAGQGDFNVDIEISMLQIGANNVQIKAKDIDGYLTTENIQVNFVSGTQWPQSYTVDWGSVANISDVAQVVDGHWNLVPGGVRTSQVGYDRLIAIGDVNWKNYEVTVPITVHSTQFVSSNPPAVGVILRWTGHFADGQQPAEKWWPLGVFGMYRYYLTNPSLRLYDRNYQVLDPSRMKLQNGVKYMFKLRAETVTGLATEYKFKVWPASVSEPTSWTVTCIESDDLTSGSMLLVAHYVDATFGDVTVVPVYSSP